MHVFNNHFFLIKKPTFIYTYLPSIEIYVVLFFLNIHMFSITPVTSHTHVFPGVHWLHIVVDNVVRRPRRSLQQAANDKCATCAIISYIMILMINFLFFKKKKKENVYSSFSITFSPFFLFPPFNAYYWYQLYIWYSHCVCLSVVCLLRFFSGVDFSVC